MKKYCIMIMVLMCAWSVSAQNAKEALQQRGFENVEVAVSGDTLFAVIEDPRYRGTFRGAGEALKLMADESPELGHFELVVLEYMIPKVAIHASIDNSLWSVDVDYETDHVRKLIRQQRRAKNAEAIANGARTGHRLSSTRSIGKIDLTFYPEVWLDNHLLDRLYLYGVFLAPAMETTLWKGNRVTVQPFIPVANNYVSGSDDRRFQLGVVSIRQDVINNGRWWLTVAAGNFRYNRVGFNANVGWKVNRNLDLSVVANWTAASRNIEGGKWFVGKPYGRYIHAKADFYEPMTRLQARLSVGQFMYGDKGARMDVSRHFGEYVIGVYGIYTKGKHQGWLHGEHQAGFNFTIPFGGRSQYRRGYFRVKLPEYFDWEYGMVSNYEYARYDMGASIEDRPVVNGSEHYWQARYIEQNLQRWLNGLIE